MVRTVDFLSRILNDREQYPHLIIPYTRHSLYKSNIPSVDGVNLSILEQLQTVVFLFTGKNFICSHKFSYSNQLLTDTSITH